MAPRAKLCPLCAQGYFKSSLPIHIQTCCKRHGRRNCIEAYSSAVRERGIESLEAMSLLHSINSHWGSEATKEAKSHATTAPKAKSPPSTLQRDPFRSISQRTRELPPVPKRPISREAQQRLRTTSWREKSAELRSASRRSASRSRHSPSSATPPPFEASPISFSSHRPQSAPVSSRISILPTNTTSPGFFLSVKPK